MMRVIKTDYRNHLEIYSTIALVLVQLRLEKHLRIKSIRQIKTLKIIMQYIH